MEVKKFGEYLKESSNYSESLIEEVQKLITNSVSSEDDSLRRDFMESYLNDNDTIIEGLVNDSDIYEFYLKFINEIDEVLIKIDFTKKDMESISAFGLYDFLVKGTLVAVKEIIREIIREIYEES